MSNVAPGSEFAIDVALGKVRLPARLDFLARNGTGVVVEDAFAFATNLIGMLGAGGRNGLLGLFDAPVELAETPPRLRFVFCLCHAGKAHLNTKITDWVDDRRKSNRGSEVSGWEDADGVLLRAGHDGALHVESALVLEGLAIGQVGYGIQVVIQGGDLAVGGRGQVTGHQVAKGEGMVAVEKADGLGKEIPLVNLGGLSGAIWAMLVHGLLCGDNGKETHLHLVYRHVWLMHVNLQQARNDGAGGVLGRVVEDERRRLDDHVQLGCRLRLDLGASLWALLERVLAGAQAVALEGLHDERLLGLVLGVGGTLDRVDRGEERRGVGVLLGAL